MLTLQIARLREVPSHAFEQGIKFLLCLLITVLLGGIFVAVVQAGIDLRHCLSEVMAGRGLHGGFRELLVDALTVLALIEIFRTAMAYFTEGRVKVTYLIDTVLVAVLTEILAFWYREVEISRMVMVIALVLVLMLVRILAIHFSPNRVEVADGL